MSVLDSGVYHDLPNWRPEDWPAVVYVSHSGFRDIKEYLPKRECEVVGMRRFPFDDPGSYVEPHCTSCGRALLEQEFRGISFCPWCGAAVVAEMLT